MEQVYNNRRVKLKTRAAVSNTSVAAEMLRSRHYAVIKAGTAYQVGVFMTLKTPCVPAKSETCAYEITAAS